MDLLQKEEPPPAANPLQPSAAVRELVLLNSPKLVPELAARAGQGNLRALQVLAGSKQETARETLMERANGGQPAERLIALNGLASNWPRQSSAILKTALDSDQPEVVAVAALGLARSKDPAAIPALLGVLKNPDSKVRRSVAAAVESLPSNQFTAQWLDALLTTDDDQVARILVNALLRDQWRDRAQLPRLAAKLKKCRDDLGFQIIRLVRHLAGDTMGPKDYFEYQENPKEWNKKWTAWAAQQ
jgi:HEAT repeat protein